MNKDIIEIKGIEQQYKECINKEYEEHCKLDETFVLKNKLKEFNNKIELLIKEYKLTIIVPPYVDDEYDKGYIDAVKTVIEDLEKLIK